MTKEKIENSNKEEIPRKSKIIKVLKRVVRTGDFESLTVEVGYEEEVEWTTIQERQKKSNDVQKLLLHDLQESLYTSMDTLGLLEVVGVRKRGNSPAEPIKSKEKPKIKVSDLDGV